MTVVAGAFVVPVLSVVFGSETVNSAVGLAVAVAWTWAGILAVSVFAVVDYSLVPFVIYMVHQMTVSILGQHFFSDSVDSQYIVTYF